MWDHLLPEAISLVFQYLSFFFMTRYNGRYLGGLTRLGN